MSLLSSVANANAFVYVNGEKGPLISKLTFWLYDGQIAD